MSRLTHRAACVILLTAWLGGGRAFAESVVLEAYAGRRPADADTLLAEVITELSRAGFAPPRQAAETIERSLSRPGAALDAGRVAEARKFITSGYDQFVDGNFELSVKDIRRGLDILMLAPATMAGAATERDMMMRGLIGLALSYKRRGKPIEATRAMAELLRSFPDKEISYQEYGPEPRKFYDKVKADLASEGLGTLHITVDDPETFVFVNERYAGVGRVTLDNLYRGRYRVYVQQGSRRGRVHDVNVDVGGQATLAIDWGLDTALKTYPTAAALEFETVEERDARTGTYAVQLARAAGHRNVAVLGIQDVGGRRAIIGVLYAVESSKPVRTAAVAIEPAEPGPERLRALGKFLAGDEDAGRLLDVLPLPPDPSDPGDGGSGGSGGVGKWIMLGAAVASAGAGVALIAADEPDVTEDGARNPVARNTAPYGYAALGLGAVLTGVSIYLFARDGGDEPGVAVVPLAGDTTGLAVGGRF